MECLIGAIYFDSKQSMNTAWKVAKNLFEPVITPENLSIHSVTQFQETCSEKRLTVTMKDLWRETRDRVCDKRAVFWKGLRRESWLKIELHSTCIMTLLKSLMQQI